MNLDREISSWDGKSATDIGKIYDQNHQHPSFTADLIRLIEETTYQRGATWLLKKHFESGNELDEEQVEKVYSLLPILDQLNIKRKRWRYLK